nr:biotin transporter BioY [Nakamurella antarctica]
MPQKRFVARDLAHIAIFAAFIAALGLPGAILIGPIGVSITLQTLGVMLAGAILGARKAAAAVLLFMVLVAAGLPLLSGGRGGLTWLTTAPSAGYPYGWLLGALFIGYFTARILPRYPLPLALLITALGGIAVVYAVGIPVNWINISRNASPADDKTFLFVLGQSAWFVLLDTVKVAVTVLIARQVHRAYPGLIAGATTMAPAFGTSRS